MFDLPRGGYPAWVITFPHTSPTSYGLGPVPKTPDCAWVSIYNLQARVWTEDFQNCPDPTSAPSCDSGCTPANQEALDHAADDARRIAGAAHVYTGARIDDAANHVVLYLAHAPQDVIDQLNAAHPGTYVIHNDAPRTAHALRVLQEAFDFKVLEPQGIQVVSVGPSVDGYLEVGVTSKVAEAQEKLDAIYGPNVVKVSKESPVILASLTARTFPRVSAIRSTQARQANAAEVRMWREKPRAFMVSGDPTVLRFVLGGNGCKPKATGGRVDGKTLTIFLRREDGCTLEARFYEVTVVFAKPIVNPARIDNVITRSGRLESRPMKLVTVLYG